MRKAYVVLAVVGLVLLTGCLHGGGGNGGDTTDVDGEESTVGVVAGLSTEDQQELQSLQQQFQIDAQQGNMSQQELRQRQSEIRQRQQEAVNASLGNITSAIENAETLEVVDQGGSQAPIIIVSGNSNEILGLLENDRVSAIVSEETASQALQAQAQGPPSPGGGQPQPRPAP